MKVFRYKPYAARFAVGFIVYVLVVVVYAAVRLFPFEEPLALQIMRLLLLASVPAAIYATYLVLVAKTAVLLVDENGLVYHDRYVRVSLKWSEITELTPRWVKSYEGKGIFFKLGLKAMENWNELQQLIIQKARLTEVKMRSANQLEWARR